MPLFLFGQPQGQHEVLWYQTSTFESLDRRLVLNVGIDLFSRLPGLRSAGNARVVDVAKLALPRHAIQGSQWLPRHGVFPATVAPAEKDRYALTIQF
ncbi:hypothetical protein [Rhizobacter sp. Root404]|uniref:hypothetical protein n=1 Tax=Rhizobacter sp. Root404 TaxID=1736528 RepID=UPI0006F5DD97|nr:hypothetical protein [Rhizobacter sp. Root404]KQW36562.1 hypothetical protein ASC76_18060 [Rhizobacter sp. Root404]